MDLHEINPFLRYAQKFHYDHTPFTKCAADARILYFLSGTGTITIDDVTKPICAGTLVLMGAGFVYRMDLEQPPEMIALNFDYDWQRKNLTMFLDPLPPEEAGSIKKVCFDDCVALSCPLVLQDMYHLEKELENIISVFQTQKLYYQEEASCLLKSLLIQLARSTLFSKSKTSCVANQLIRYLQEHYQEDLTSDQIAEKFNYHAYHINRIMRSATGTTVHKYLINYRINVSKNLLTNTDLSIEEISAAVGFQNTPYFSNSFKRIVGCSPSFYRIAHLENV